MYMKHDNKAYYYAKTPTIETGLTSAGFRNRNGVDFRP